MSERAFHLTHRLGVTWLGCALLAASGCRQGAADTDTQQSAEQTFGSVCAKCHGSDGKGGLPAAEGANPPRNFCDAAFQASRTDDDLKLVIRKGKGGMPAFGNLFSDAELQGLVHKIRSFKPSTQVH